MKIISRISIRIIRTTYMKDFFILTVNSENF